MMGATKTTDLLAIAERCVKVTGPDRHLDATIYRAVTPTADGCPRYTASLDAAMTLVPEGHCGQVQFGKRTGAWVAPLADEHPADFNVAATPALALCAAALRAMEASNGKGDDQ